MILFSRYNRFHFYTRTCLYKEKKRKREKEEKRKRGRGREGIRKKRKKDLRRHWSNHEVSEIIFYFINELRENYIYII